MESLVEVWRRKYYDKCQDLTCGEKALTIAIRYIISKDLADSRPVLETLERILSKGNCPRCGKPPWECDCEF